MTRFLTILDGFIDAGLIVLLIFTPLAFGSVEIWAQAIAQFLGHKNSSGRFFAPTDRQLKEALTGGIVALIKRRIGFGIGCLELATPLVD